MYKKFFLYCIFLVFAILSYILILANIIDSAVILNEFENQYCTGGKFLHKVTIFALIAGLIGFISGNTANIIMLILYYAMHYNIIQEQSGDCQMKDSNLYNSVITGQKLLLALLFLSIPSVMVVIVTSLASCGVICFECCKTRKKQIFE